MPPHDSPATPRSTLSNAYQRDWPAYFAAVRTQPPRDTLLRALATFPNSPPAREHWALDIACGEGRDTRAILAHPGPRFRVVAIDSSAAGLELLHASVAPVDSPRLHTFPWSMESLTDHAAELASLTPRFDLINASFALPFCEPAHFPRLWAFLRAALAPGGRFAGQFFGDRDEWAPIRPASHHTRAETLALLAGWTVEHFEEIEKDGSDAMGGTKHHHLFHVVAQAPAAATS